MVNEKILSNGVRIPQIGYGTSIVFTYKYKNNYNNIDIAKYWTKNFLKNKKQFKMDTAINKILSKANSLGCRMFDTSRAYAGSEYSIGKMLNKNDRSKFFIITKLCNSDQRIGNVEAALKKSLSELQTDYVDLYLIHWPQTGTWIKCWKQLETMYKRGLCRAIGVCNCNIHHLEELKSVAEIMPMVNQFECHPLFAQDKLRKYCKDNDIQVMAYTPTARMDERLSKTVLTNIAEKYHKSMAQIILKWHIQIGNIPIVNTSSIDHLKDNIDIFDFALTNEEVDSITKININSRLRYDPDNCDFSKL
ncbi:MAG: aldo/keto reductase [Clostridium sp.]|nr:aldo/keto reductase [Clostridium sp.]